MEPNKHDPYAVTRAMHRIAKALKSGELIRPGACELCGDKPESQPGERSKIFAHHWRGYDYPLDVWFICQSCSARLVGPRFHNGSVTKDEAIQRVQELRSRK